MRIGEEGRRKVYREVNNPASKKRTPEDILEDHLRMMGLPEFEREYKFLSDRRFRADFALPSHRLLVEVEGGVWVDGRHSRGVGYTRDCEKYNLAALEGWKVLRFTVDMVKSGEAVKMIEKVLRRIEEDGKQVC
jgi:very-short-patch-repair endonuclease